MKHNTIDNVTAIIHNILPARREGEAPGGRAGVLPLEAAAGRAPGPAWAEGPGPNRTATNTDSNTNS